MSAGSGDVQRSLLVPNLVWHRLNADRAGKQLFGLFTLVKRIFALLRRDIRARLDHCWANSLVDVCGAALKGIADQSRGALEEMRAARGLIASTCIFSQSTWCFACCSVLRPSSQKGAQTKKRAPASKFRSFGPPKRAHSGRKGGPKRVAFRVLRDERG